MDKPHLEESGATQPEKSTGAYTKESGSGPGVGNENGVNTYAVENSPTELGKDTNMHRVERTARLKRALEKIAFASLFVDICISIITLISINYGRVVYTVDAIYLLDYVLTAIVVLSVIVFAAIFLFSHYDKIMNALLLRNIRNRKIK